METVRIDVHAYTASFRVPGMMGYQVTSPVPPPSMVYGLIAAAAGREVTPQETGIAYRFEYDALATDLETILIYDEKGPVWNAKHFEPKTNVLRRQFLAGARLTLYIHPGEVAESFLSPRFPLLLGRTQDVAFVASYRHVAIEPVDEAEVSGVLLPFPTKDSMLRSRIMSFTTFFSVGPDRRARAVKPFHVLDALNGSQNVNIPNLLYREAGERFAVPYFNEKQLDAR